MKKTTILIIATFTLLFSSCSFNYYKHMTPEKMEQLQLGMSKEKVVDIL